MAPDEKKISKKLDKKGCSRLSLHPLLPYAEARRAQLNWKEANSWMGGGVEGGGGGVGGQGGSWRLLLSLPRSSPSPSVPACLQTRHPTQPPLLGKLGRCMTQVTREHRSGVRRLFKNSSTNVSGRVPRVAAALQGVDGFRLIDGLGHGFH